MAAVTICSDFGAPENKVWHCLHCFPIYLPWSDGTGYHDLSFLLDTMILVFWMLSFKPAFSLSSFTLIKRLFSFSSLSTITVVSSAYLRLLIFLPAIFIPEHARPPCPSPTSRACSNSYLSNGWCHSTISSSIVPFSSYLQSFPASGSFLMSQFFTSGGQSIYWSFSCNISPSYEYSGLISFRMDWLNLLAVQGTLKSLLQHHSSKASILQCSALLTVQLSHPYMTIRKTTALTIWTSVGRVMSLLSAF